jgi:hypothetical protein
MKLTKKSVIALILAAVALVGLGGATLALAAPAILSGHMPGWPWGGPGWGSGGFGRGAVGTVKSIDASQLVVTAANGQTITMTVTSQTQIYLLPGRTAGKVTDIKVGDTVQVQARRTTTGALEAQTITVGPLELRVAGQVTAVDGTNLTLQAGQNTQTIVTDTNTKFYVSGNQAGSLTDVKTGEFVTALIQKQSDGSLLASQVEVAPQGGFGGGMGGMMGRPGTDENRVAGQVTAVDGAKVTVQVGQSTQTFVTDANTKFYVSGNQAGTLADVKTGEFVMALVQKQSDGSLLASQVMVGNNAGPMWNPGNRQRPGMPGQRPKPLFPNTSS